MRLQRLELDRLSEVSRKQLERSGPDSELESRIATFELAFSHADRGTRDTGHQRRE